MARSLGILVICGALVGCGASSAAPRTGQARVVSPKCGTQAARTLARGKFARVYETHGLVYGCVAGSGRRYQLGRRGSRPGGISVGVVTVAGQLAAYSVMSHGVDTSRSSVVVRRLSDGRQLRHDDATVGALGPETFQSVDSLVLKADGGVAWIGSASSIARHGKQIQVLRHDSRGLKVLDSGSTIPIRSLRLQRSTLRWRSGAATRTANLR